MKQCYSLNRKSMITHCGLEKPLSEFFQSKANNDGYDNLCKDCRRKIKRKYQLSEKGKLASERNSNLEKNVIARREYGRANKLRRNEYEKQKRAEDPQYKLKHSIRTRTNNFFRNKGIFRDTKMEVLLGCSWEYLKRYIEERFLPGMTWENHGKWHIDHIKPLAKIDLTVQEEFKKAFHHSNLQPLWALDNMRKKDKY